MDTLTPFAKGARFNIRRDATLISVSPFMGANLKDWIGKVVFLYYE